MPQSSGLYTNSQTTQATLLIIPAKQCQLLQIQLQVKYNHITASCKATWASHLKRVSLS